MEIKKAVIPVAGTGTRLLPVTKSQPKEMLPVGRKPVVQYVVEEAEAAGLKEVLFITGRQKTSIADHFDRDVELIRRLTQSGKSEMLEELVFEEMGLSYYYVRQSEPKGLANAVYHAKDFVGPENFVVALGDTIIKGKDGGELLQRMIKCHLKNKAACTIAVEEVALEHIYRYGAVKPKGAVGDEFLIEDLVEKPMPQEAPSNLAIAARYILSPAVFDSIKRTVPDEHGELWLTDSIRILLNQGLKVYCVKLREDQRRYDIGNFESYFKAFVDFAIEDEKYGYTLRQHLYRTIGQIAP